MATLARIRGAVRDKVAIDVVLEHRLSAWKYVKEKHIHEPRSRKSVL